MTQAPAGRGETGGEGEEVVTRALARDVEMPGGAGTMVLVTLDNGFDHRKPNVFGARSLAEIGAALDRARERAAAGEITAVGLTGKPFVFAVGADLTVVPTIRTREQALEVAAAGHATFAKLADLGVPSFAFVGGAALGGGVEVALHCAYRTMSRGVTAFGLPECFLGLLPGWGGCWLVPNLVGIERAIRLVIDNPLEQNRLLSGAQAHELGLSDVLLDPADFLAESIRWAAGVVAGEREVARPPVDRDAGAWDRAIAAARERVEAKTGGAAPAPRAALDLLAAARTCTRDEGFAAEDASLADLLMGEELRGGLYAFDLLRRRAKRPVGAPDASLARPVSKVGLVGAGLMAGQLALLLARRLQVPVVLTDLDAKRVEAGVAYVHGEIDALEGRGRLSRDRASRYRALVTGDTDKAVLADAELVIEAVFEDLDVKRRVFAEVEALVATTCVLATNTSSLSVSRMAEGLDHPGRVVGMHFFNPVAVMPLVEVVRGERTDEASAATAFATARALRKTAILVRDSPSFVVNRLLGKVLSDVLAIVDGGTPIAVAENALAGVTPLPPFRLVGLVGPAIALHNGETLAGAFPDRYAVSPSLRRVVEAGKREYYLPGPDGSLALDPEVEAFVAPAADPVQLTAEQVRAGVLAGLAQEARLVLDEGVVAAPEELDLAMITGAGFPLWNGGLLPLLDRAGIARAQTGRRFHPVGVASAPTG